MFTKKFLKKWKLSVEQAEQGIEKLTDALISHHVAGLPSRRGIKPSRPDMTKKRWHINQSLCYSAPNMALLQEPDYISGNEYGINFVKHGFHFESKYLQGNKISENCEENRSHRLPKDLGWFNHQRRPK